MTRRQIFVLLVSFLAVLGIVVFGVLYRGRTQSVYRTEAERGVKLIEDTEKSEKVKKLEGEVKRLNAEVLDLLKSGQP